MIRLLGFLAAILLTLAVIGYYRGWFHANAQNANGHETVTLTVDKDKMNQDKSIAEQHLQDLEHK
jgi:hypothetical protein